MKLKDFLTLKVGSGVLVSGTRYNPLINYDWSTTTTSGLRYLKDIGSTPAYNASMYFGRGVYLNGVDQSIDYGTLDTSSAEVSMVFRGNSVICCHKYNFWTVRNGFQYYLADGSTLVVESILFDSIKTYTLNITPTLIELFENGVKILTKIPKSLLNGGAKTIGTRYTFYRSSIIKDLFMFNRTLTQAEITQSYEQPEAFYTMAQADSACVLNMPMCETDGYVRNMKSYSEGSNLVGAYANTYYGAFGTQGTLTKDKDIYTQTVTVVGTSNTFPRCDFVSSGIRYANKAYVYEFDYEVLSGTCILTGFFHGGIFGAQVLTGKGRVCVVSIGTQDRSSNNIYFDGRNLFSVKYWNFSVKELTAIYPISNYLSTCRTNAQRLPYGLQTSGFKRDSNGLILSKSNFLEADSVGYGNTGWVPKWNEDFTVESVFEVSNDSEFRLNGNNYADGIYFGKNSGGKSLYVRVFGSPVILLANSKDIVCLIFSYNWQTKEVKQYVDGVLVTTQLATKTTNAIDPVLLGLTALGGGNYPVIKPLRLFKTHSKVLTQEEVSKNFNKYQAQGLLNE